MKSGLYYDTKIDLLIEIYFYDSPYQQYVISRYDFFNGGTITYQEPYLTNKFFKDLVYIGKVI